MNLLDKLFRRNEKEINNENEIDYMINEDKVNLVVKKLKPQETKEKTIINEKEYIFPSELVIKDGNIEIYNYIKKTQKIGNNTNCIG